MSEARTDEYIGSLVRRLRVETPHSRQYQGLMNEAAAVIEALNHALQTSVRAPVDAKERKE